MEKCNHHQLGNTDTSVTTLRKPNHTTTKLQRQINLPEAKPYSCIHQGGTLLKSPPKSSRSHMDSGVSSKHRELRGLSGESSRVPPSVVQVQCMANTAHKRGRQALQPVTPDHPPVCKDTHVLCPLNHQGDQPVKLTHRCKMNNMLLARCW